MAEAEREIEAKFYVRDLAKIELRLRAAGAQPLQERVHELNLRFDTKANNLRKAFSVLRLRRDNQARLTYKGAGTVEDGGILNRREIEFVVEDFEKARELLEALGYRVVAFYEKFRATYQLRETLVMLDELPFGCFVEIEGREAVSIRAVALALGLEWSAAVKEGYLTLFEKVAPVFGLDSSQLSFSAFQGIQVKAEDLGVCAADGQV
jgi:adenylate cyclase class 2